jgi:hypothetical protein
LTHVGTGPWYGIDKISACAYRNDRVLVVNVYCTTKEGNAFRVDIHSPTRGRVEIYAEAASPISTLARTRYQMFTADSQQADPELPALAGVTFTALHAYDEKRARAKSSPTCFGGDEGGAVQGDCTTGVEAHAEAWIARNGPFLTKPNPEWYRLVKELRARARRDGTNAR